MSARAVIPIDRYAIIPDPARNALFELASKLRRIEASLSGNFSTPTKIGEARELLVEIVRLAWVLRRAL